MRTAAETSKQDQPGSNRIKQDQTGSNRLQQCVLTAAQDQDMPRYLLVRYGCALSRMHLDRKIKRYAKLLFLLCTQFLVRFSANCNTSRSPALFRQFLWCLFLRPYFFNVVFRHLGAASSRSQALPDFNCQCKMSHGMSDRLSE